MDHKRYEEIADRAVQSNKEYMQNEATWLRHILTLAGGALTLLAVLGPTPPPEGVSQYLLAATWAFLGIGIASGAAATYLDVDRAKKSTEMLLQMLKGHSPPVRSRNIYLLLCKHVMIVSLLAAVLCLAGYAIINTLGV